MCARACRRIHKGCAEDRHGLLDYGFHRLLRQAHMYVYKHRPQISPDYCTLSRTNAIRIYEYTFTWVFGADEDPHVRRRRIECTPTRAHVLVVFSAPLRTRSHPHQPNHSRNVSWTCLAPPPGAAIAIAEDYVDNAEDFRRRRGKKRTTPKNKRGEHRGEDGKRCGSLVIW